MNLLFMFLNTVSYAAMTLPTLMQEEMDFLKSKTFLSAQKSERRQRLMKDIYQSVRSGKVLPMFTPEHRIQPPVKKEEEQAA